MIGWIWFALAFAVFLASHRLPLRPAVRARLVTGLGERGFTVTYSILSVILLVWLIVAAGRAPYVEIWSRQAWQTWVPLGVMAVVCLLVALSVARPNPFSFGGMQTADFDPARPGIVRWVRHPLLLALALWAGAHLVPNGDLAHVILFCIFAAFALTGMRIVDRRKRRLMGAERWNALRKDIARGPVFPRPRSPGGLALRLASAALLYGGLIALHPLVIGVSPLP